jgi:hypothetical protein
MSPVIVDMGTTVNFLGLGFNFGEESTKPEPYIPMAQLVAEGDLNAALDCAIAMLEIPSDVDDGFPFLADGHLEELIPAFK